MFNAMFLISQLEAIRQTKVDMQVYLGNYNLPNDNNAAYNRQKQELQDAITTYGANNIAGITVGNEYILKCVVVVVEFLCTLSDWIHHVHLLAMFYRMGVVQQTVLLVIKVQHFLFPILRTHVLC